jgi:HK97 family phage major capsid protein
MSKHLELLEGRRSALVSERDGLLENSTPETFTDEVQARTDALENDIKSLEARIAEQSERDAAEKRAAKVTPTVHVGNEANPVYRQDKHDTSFFRDLAASSLNISLAGASPDQARGRLAASQARANDMTTVAGAGGTFAPPLWQVENFIALARAGRVAANLLHNEVLPSGVSSINLPKVASGATAAVQATQGTALSDTAMTTTSVSTAITTIGGKQIISMQLLQQSGIPFDKVILQDLAKAYAIQVDTQVLYGSGSSGQVSGLVGVAANNAFTTLAPAPASVTSANSLYYTVAKAAAAMQAAIFEAPDAIIMHPNRWAWVLGAVDSSARPFVIPNGPQFNGLGVSGDQVAQGLAGYFGSYPVYTDPNISTTANSATNQDEIYLVKRDELWLYESPVQAESFTATYADQASVLFRILGYMGLIANRYTGAVQSIRGTGLVAP